MALSNAQLAALSKRNKYHVAAKADRTAADGTVFASKAEMRRYQELRLLSRFGEINDLKLQVRFPLVVNGQKICTYVADFVYVNSRTGRRMVEDVKGMVTPIFRIKQKLMRAVYGIEIFLSGQKKKKTGRHGAGKPRLQLHPL